MEKTKIPRYLPAQVRYFRPPSRPHTRPLASRSGRHAGPCDRGARTHPDAGRERLLHVFFPPRWTNGNYTVEARQPTRRHASGIRDGQDQVTVQIQRLACSNRCESPMGGSYYTFQFPPLRTKVCLVAHQNYSVTY
jgi:hypothetical protein